MFFDHHRELTKRSGEIAQADVIFSCDLYSLRAASKAKRRNPHSILVYDARELYTGLPAVKDRPFRRWLWKKWEHDGMLETDMMTITAPHDVQAIFEVHRFVPRPILLRNIPLRPTSKEGDHAFLRAVGIADGQKIIVYLGGLQKDRGLEASIGSLKHLSEEYVLLLMGDGAERKALQDLANSQGLEQRVFFAGSVSSEKTLAILRGCDVGLSLIEANSPSYQLALPSKIFEYLMAGIPVVSSPLLHVQALFHNEPWLVYADPGDTRAIADRIQRLTTETDSIKEGLDAASQRYSFEADFAPLLTLLTERLKDRR